MRLYVVFRTLQVSEPKFSVPHPRAVGLSWYEFFPFPLYPCTVLVKKFADQWAIQDESTKMLAD